MEGFFNHYFLVNKSPANKRKKPLKKSLKAFNVFPKGFEPISVEPESTILSIELRKHFGKYINLIGYSFILFKFPAFPHSSS